MKQQTKLVRLCHRRERIFWLCILAVGILARFAFLGAYPKGFLPDEASIGYEAWSLLHYGVDRNGVSWPVLFVGWGSGQNVLYAYLSMPFIALLGLNELSVRLVSAIVGVLALPVFYALLKRLHSVPVALLGMLVLAVNPWHVMASRWALESNILPFFLLLGVYCMVLALEKPWFYLGVGASFALGLYAYGTAFAFLPLFLLGSLAYLLWRHKKAIRWVPLLCGLGLFILLALPIAVCNLLNLMGWESIHLGPVTLPLLNEARSVLTMDFSPSGIWANTKLLVDILWNGSDGLPHNSLPGGMMFLWGWLPLALLGTIRSARAVFRPRPDAKDRGEGLMLLWLVCAFLPSIFIEGNINRINYMHIPLIYMTVMGLVFLLENLPRLYLDKKKHLPQRFWALCTALLIGLSTLHFAYLYTSREYRAELYPSNRFGLRDAIAYAETVDRPKTFIEIYGIGEPYIYVLFYNQIPPEEFLDTVEYANPDAAFRQIDAFGKYTFAYTTAWHADTVYILWYEEIDPMLTVLDQFGYFVVAVLEE